VPKWGDLHNNLGCVRQAQGRFNDAADSYRQAIRVEPGNATAHANLAFILNRNGNLDEAAEHYRQAIALRPNDADSHSNLGNIHLQRRQFDQAQALYKRALSINPLHSATHNNFGNLHRAQGRQDQAEVCYRQAIALRPDYADAHNNLGCVLLDQGHGDAAIQSFKRALSIDPDHADANCNLGVALQKQGNLDEAMGCFQRAIALKPGYAEAHNNLAARLRNEGRLEDATACCDLALVLRPELAEAHCTRGNIFQDQGRLAEAEQAFRRAAALKPGYPEAHYSLSQIKSFRSGDHDLAELESLVAKIDSFPIAKRPYLHFGLAKALDDIGAHTRSFEQFVKGNLAKRRSISYTEAEARDYLEQIARVFDAELLERCRGGGDASVTPIFILGMPRSGTTLIEQILTSHPRIHGAGELSALSSAANNVPGHAMSYPESCANLDREAIGRLATAYLQRQPALPAGKSLMTDKTPGNFEFVGLIHLLFPRAKIIHTVRNPADTCFSCFSKLFATGMPYTYDLAELGRYYRWYQKLMDHWHTVLPPGTMVDVSYEAMVDDLPKHARRLLDYVGVEWDDRCVHFHQNPRPVSTASNVQVRQPLYRGSVNRWQRYRHFLSQLLDELPSD
jgi:tetratricopeptide (TPR) repeat protein